MILVPFAWSCCALALAGLVLEIANLPEFPILRPRETGRRRHGTVVACVAMRNERSNAEPCITTLLRQLEISTVVACDDGSSDETAAILAALAQREPRLHVVPGPVFAIRGKAHALARAASQAEQLGAPLLLFTDADVRLVPGAVGALLERMETAGADAVSAWPKTECRSCWDAAFSSLTVLLLLQALPLRLARRSSDSRFAAATGQLILVTTAAYRRSGGHAASTAIVEDVALARTLKRAGARVVLAAGPMLASTVGYGRFADNVMGYGRSLVLGSGRRGAVVFGIWQTCAFAAPWLLVPFEPVPACIAVGAALIAHTIASRRSGGPRVPAWAVFAGSPLAAGAAFWFAVRGARGLRWRGRPVLRRLPEATAMPSER